MTQLISILGLPFPVSVNMAYRNVLRVGRVKTAAYKKWLAEAEAHIFENGIRGGIEGPYSLEIELDRQDKRRRDLDNYTKVLSDFLVAHRFVQDDSLCERLQIKWTAPIPDRPGPVRVWLIATKGE